jgi:ATP-dependent Lon protease
VVAQNDSNIEDPELKDLCTTGTVAKIVKLIKMPDGGTTVIIQGKKRFRMLSLTEEELTLKQGFSYLQMMKFY